VDLGKLRVALGGEEVEAALAEHAATAVAIGDTLLFAEANPDPALVAHEVTHVLQQRQGGSGGGEAEAEAGAQAVRSGQSFSVKGGAPQKPQFAKSAGTRSKGKVSLELSSGAAITPPSFPGGLEQLHRWLMDNQAAMASYTGDLHVHFEGTLRQDRQVIWSYYHPHQKLVLDGGGKAVVSGFTEAAAGKEYASPGYFLAYRPIIPQAMSAENPAAANLSMKGLTIRGFVSGGLEICPRSGNLPSGEALAAGNPEQGHGQGGITAFVSGATILNNHFEELGTRYMRPGAERYAPTTADAAGQLHNEDGYQYAGYGGIVARGLNASTIAGNHFSGLENRDSKKTSEVDGGKVNWLGLMHGIYARDHSSNNSIRNNRFDGISGAAVKFTNASNYNKVRNNRADNTGKDSFILDHYSLKSPGGVVEADSLGYNNKGIARAPDKKKYLFGNQPGSSYQGYGRQKPLSSFLEKKVKP
jgi:hypothetical protein